MTLILSLVDSLEKAQDLRVLRNECRYFMTGSTSEITEEQQGEFFRNRIQHGEVTALLIYRETQPVAYALLRQDGDKTWMSCGVSEPFRGRGLGLMIVRAITTVSVDKGFTSHLEVWRDNIPARRTYDRTGYRLVGSAVRDGRIVDSMEFP